MNENIGNEKKGNKNIKALVMNKKSQQPHSNSNEMNRIKCNCSFERQ